MWSLFRRNSRQTKSIRRTPSTIRPRLEILEHRCLMSAGALDPTFGNGAGYVTSSLTNSNDYGASTVIEPNGTLIQSGVTTTIGNGHKFTYAVGLTAYNPDGSVDTAFGNGGKVIGPTSAGGGAAVNDFLYPSTDPNGNGGKFVVTGVKGFAIARYNANGTLDSTFGQNGIASANFGTTLGTAGTTSAVIQSDGKVVVLGLSANDATAELARFNANGTLDTTFGNGGLATAAVPEANALLLQPDGSLIVVGSATINTGLGMAELNANGALNTSFGNGGIVTSSAFGDGLAGTLGMADPTGRTIDDQIIVTGQATSEGGRQLARYNPDGTLDTTFGNGGIVNTGGPSFGTSVAVQPDGKLVSLGRDTASALGIIRYNADGTLDTTFGSGGIVATQIGVKSLTYGNASGLILDPNGNIVAAASSYYGSKWNFAVARYLSSALAEPSQPQIGSFTANPNPVNAGSTFTLTVSGLTDSNPNSTITQVVIYWDHDQDGGTLNTSTDWIYGFATQTSPGVWTITNLNGGGFGVAGIYKLFAQAEDSDGVYSDPVALTLTVQ